MCCWTSSRFHKFTSVVSSSLSTPSMSTQSQRWFHYYRVRFCLVSTNVFLEASILCNAGILRMYIMNSFFELTASDVRPLILIEFLFFFL